MTDAVFVTGLALHAYHGVMQHEAKVGQTFQLDLVLDIDLTEASHSDKLADTVGYDQVVEVATPALISVTAGIAEPRYASLKGIMAARSKEIKQIGLGDLGIEKGEPAETIQGLTDAETRKAGAVIEDDGTAVDRIIQVLVEAKVV